MQKTNLIKIRGYIEGYYGKLLSWDERRSLITTLKENKMNYYFYCPKEDLFHRKNWKNKYPKDWLQNFKSFCHYANKQGINIIAGISPGLDYSFKSELSNRDEDFNKLLKKIKKLIEYGANNIAILFDDIPKNEYLQKNQLSEGAFHANLTNKINEHIDINLFTVPRIYSDELIHEDPHYLNDFFKVLSEKTYIFYCGKFTVSSNFKTNFNETKKIITQNKIIFWDNYYCNDYCPKKLIIGPWKNKTLINYSMINGTGLVNTDKLIIEIVNSCGESKEKFKVWKEIILKNKIPKHFFYFHKYFLSPNFTNENNLKIIPQTKNTIKSIDYLLWNWKSPLALEWYPFLFNLKHDLQILNNQLSFNRILKTQTNPMQIKLLMDKNLK